MMVRLLFFIALLTVAGCKCNHPLSSSMPLRSDTETTTCIGVPIPASALNRNYPANLPLGEKRHPDGDFLTVESPGDYELGAGPNEELPFPIDNACNGLVENMELGMALFPGMVLHVATWSGGPTYDQAGQLGGPTRLPPVGEPLRLPIRTIGAQGHLDDSEWILLGSVLSAQRPRQWNAPSGDKTMTWLAHLGDAFASEQPMIWNTFIKTARIKRLQLAVIPNNPLEPKPDPNIIWRPEPINRLLLTLDFTAYCTSLRTTYFPPDGTIPDGPDVPLNDEQMRRKHIIDAMGCPKPDSNQPSATKAVDVLSGLTPFASPAHTITAKKADNKDEFHGKASAHVEALQGFVSVDLNGLSLKDAAWPENTWNLLEWEQAGVCLIPPTSSNKAARIERVKLAGIGWLDVIDTGKPTHTVVEIIRPRKISRSVKRADPDSWWIILNPTILRTDLRRLYPSDLAAVYWTPAANGKENSCSFDRRN